MNIKKINENVYQAIKDPYIFTEDDCKTLISTAESHISQRARINIHGSSTDPIHEMLIAFTNKSIILPHKHPAKTESFHIIQGKVSIHFYEEDGSQSQIPNIILENSSSQLFYRLNRPLIHKVVPLSQICIIHEVTNGPFIPGKSSIFPDWV